MRHGPKSGRPGVDLYSLFAPGNVFQRDLHAMAKAADQTPAKHLGNVARYSDPTYSYDGAPAPHFYGFAQGVVPFSTPSGTTHTKGAITFAAPAIYLVPRNTPTQRVEMRDTTTQVPFTSTTANGLQTHMEAVPVPDISKILASPANLASGGTDKEVVILRRNVDGTVEMWEFWQFQWDAVKETYFAHWGAYVGNTREWMGVYPYNWGARATSLACVGGTITLHDLRKVARGEAIDHALGITVPATGPTHVEPATRQDTKPEPGYNNKIAPEHGGVANPAFGEGGVPPDALRESQFFVLPAGLNPAEFGFTKPLELAIFRCLQGNPTGSKLGGLFIDDGGSGGCNFNVECPLSMGSGYSLEPVNPLAGSPILDERGAGAGGPNEAINYIPAGMADSSLPVINEHLNISTVYKNTASCFSALPLQLAEVVEPFAP